MEFDYIKIGRDLLTPFRMGLTEGIIDQLAYVYSSDVRIYGYLKGTTEVSIEEMLNNVYWYEKMSPETYITTVIRASIIDILAGDIHP